MLSSARTQENAGMERSAPIQLQLELPYKQQPSEHPRVRAYLDRGYRLLHLQRLTDQESLVTLAPPGEPARSA